MTTVCVCVFASDWKRIPLLICWWPVGECATVSNTKPAIIDKYILIPSHCNQLRQHPIWQIKSLWITALHQKLLNTPRALFDDIFFRLRTRLRQLAPSPITCCAVCVSIAIPGKEITHSLKVLKTIHIPIETRVLRCIHHDLIDLPPFDHSYYIVK